MAVSSVHNTPAAGTQALQQSHKNTSQSQGTGQTHNAAQATQATQTARTNSTQNVQQQTQTQTAQAPKPVVNGQGQKTGQVLNTTA
jgi:hypothetical protein